MRKSWGHWAALAAAGAMLFATGASAQPDAGLKLSLGYDGKLLYIKVLNVELREDIEPAAHSSSAQITSSGILAAFKKFDIEATESGPIARGDPQPGLFKHWNHDGKRNRKVEVEWTGSDVLTQSNPEMTFLGDPPASRQQKLNSVGYLTAVMRLTVAADAGPCKGSEMIFNGKELSELGFSSPRPTGLSDGQKRLGLINGVRCNATFKEIAGYKKKKGKDQNQGLDRPIEVDFAQIGEGGPWVAARLEAHTQLGPALIELARIKAVGKLPEGLIQAADR
jgi:hypothetical protein